MEKTMHEPIQQRPGARPAGFTLLEVLVAVGAVALVAVGLATIFDSVGKTVSGGRRISLLTQYAGLLENRMRRDFDEMTRDGVLVIRQQWTDGTIGATWSPDGLVTLVVPNNTASADAVRLHARDEAPRPRRIDELVFFVRDSVRSARPPLHADAVAESSEARIYYGHGAAHIHPLTDVESDLTNRFYFPRTDDINHRGLYPTFDAPLGLNRADNPNRYASDWTLLRHVTLLVNPESARPPALSGPVFGIAPTSPRLGNNDFQYALQPAAPSIFKAINRPGVLFGPDAPNAAFALRPTGQSPEVFRPALVFASGLIDIATSDLNEVRAMVTSMPEASAFMIPGRPRPPLKPTGRFNFTAPTSTRPTNPAAATSLDLAHDWMAQLFPTESNPMTDAMFKIGGAQDAADPLGARIRYEQTPPALLNDNVINATSGAGATGQQALAMAIRRADQLMLGSSIFAARCSEFIVEWSFGQTLIGGEIFWYGPERYADTSNNGWIDGPDSLITLPYGAGGLNLVGQAYTTQPPLGGLPGIGVHTVTQRLIYGYSPVPGQACLTSYFGYVDPTFNADPNGNGVFGEANEPVVRSLPWTWPRLIRVTMTLADPIDPSIESTFQFVFNVPDAPTR